MSYWGDEDLVCSSVMMSSHHSCCFSVAESRFLEAAMRGTALFYQLYARERRKEEKEKGGRKQRGISGRFSVQNPLHFQHCSRKIGTSGCADPRKEGKREKGRKDEMEKQTFSKPTFTVIHFKFFSCYHFQPLNGGWVCGFVKFTYKYKKRISCYSKVCK